MNYFWKTLQHKWFVLIAGLQTGAPLWRLIIHDWSKFTPSEYPHYQRNFFGAKDDPEGFARAWIHHQNTNPHHWEYWFDRSKNEWAEMPMWAVREMVADWMGASRAYEGVWPQSFESWPWMQKNFTRIATTVHPNTGAKISSVLSFAIPFETKPELAQ